MNTAQAVDTILDTQRVSEICTHPVYTTHVRIKPQVAIIAAVADQRTGQPSGWVRLLWPISHSKARKAHALAATYGESTHRVSLDDDMIADCGPIHTDPTLAPHLWAWKHAHIDHIPQPPRTQKATSDNTEQGTSNADTAHDNQRRVLRYNPLRRLVLRQGQQVLRFYAQPRTHEADITRLITQHVPTPPQGQDPLNADHPSAPHIATMAYCGDGDIAHLTSNAHAHDAQRAHYQAGRLFAALHAAPLNAQHDRAITETLASRIPDTQAQAQAHVGILEHLDPQIAQRLRDIAQCLHAHTHRHRDVASTTQLVLSHGDASADQVLASADLSTMWLTDFDRACLASPALDLGSYTAVCNPQASAAFLDGYTQAGGPLPNSRELDLAQAASLIRRLAEPLKKGDPQWRTHMNQRLTRIEELLS